MQSSSSSVVFGCPMPKALTNPDYDYPSIGYDELYEILSWLPAKSAVKFSSSLYKSMLNLPSNSNFIEKQSIHAYGQDSGFFIQPKNNYVQDQYFHPLPNSDSGIPNNYFNGGNGGRIFSSSNGLLLMGYKPEIEDAISDNVEFWLCNPATSEWGKIKTPEGYKFIVKNDHFTPVIECRGSAGFPRDYTVGMLVSSEEDDLGTKMLVYRDGEWEDELLDVGLKGRYLRYDVPVATFSGPEGGLLVHYLSESVGHAPSIVTFDLQKKRLWRETQLPEGAWDMEVDYGWGTCNRLGFFKWDDSSVCVVRRYLKEFRVWVMDSKGVWRKVMETKVEEEEDIVGYNVVGARGGHYLVVACGYRVYLCGMEGENKGKWVDLGDHGFDTYDNLRFVTYANTLRPVCVEGFEV